MLLKNALVYTGDGLAPLDVRIGDGRIKAIGQNLDGEGHETLDLSGLSLSPGFIDVHTHLREPGFSHKETIASGTRAAAAGGFTTLCAMPNVNPPPDTLPHLEKELALIQAHALVEVLPYGTLTMGQNGETLADMAALAPHVIGFTDDGKGVQNPALMQAAMETAKGLGLRIAAHCEDESLIPPGGCVHEGAAKRFGLPPIPSISEWRQVERDIALLRETMAPYHICHVSAKETVALVRGAKKEGLPITCECTPHQLLLCEEDIIADDGRFKMNPPLRSRADQEALMEGLLDGTIDLIATDHAPHTQAEKGRGLSGSAFGVVGLETAFAACYTALVQPGLCDLAFLLQKLTVTPGRLLGRDIAIRPGSPADLVVLDVREAFTVDPAAFQSQGRASPFAGMTLYGKVKATIRQGRIIYGEGATT